MSKTTDREAELAALALAHASPGDYAAAGFTVRMFSGVHTRMLAENAERLMRENGPRLLDWAREYHPHLERLYQAIEDAPMAFPEDLLKRLEDAMVTREAESALNDAKAALERGDAAAAAEAAQRAAEAASGRVARDIVPMSRVIVDAAAASVDINSEERARWIKPPLENWRIGHLKPGQMLVIAAGTNVGKSQAAMHLLAAIAAAGHKCGYVSIEDDAAVVGQRYLARLSGISTHIQDSFLEGDPMIARRIIGQIGHSVERDRVDRLFGNLMFAERVGATTSEVCSTVIRLAAMGCKVIAVDYLQEIDTSEDGIESRHIAVSRAVRALKALCVRYRFCLVLVSQLNRQGARDSREGFEPSLHDLKETGDVENKAELVVLMRKGEGGLIVASLAKAKGLPFVGAQWCMKHLPELGGMLGDVPDAPPEAKRRKRRE